MTASGTERRVRRRAYEILQVAAPGDRASAAFDVAMIALIVLNIIAVVLETVEPIYAAAPAVFRLIEVVSIAGFSVEYVLRLWSGVEEPGYSSALRGRLRFAARPLMLVEFLAVAPSLAPFRGFDLRAFRVLRVFRLLRVAKLTRYTDALQSIHRAIAEKKEELVSTLSFMLVLVLVSASALYFAERDVQPDAFGSIPAAMWWGVATLTTVGYGDAYPVTLIGKMLGGVIAVLGIGMVALPTGILGAGFVEQLERRKAQRSCPHCGEPL